MDTGGAPHEVKEHTAPNFAVQAAASEALLGRWLRLYQIHSATLDSGVLDAPDVMAALEAAKKQHGWCIGLSLSGAARPRSAPRGVDGGWRVWGCEGQP